MSLSALLSLSSLADQQAYFADTCFLLDLIGVSRDNNNATRTRRSQQRLRAHLVWDALQNAVEDGKKVRCYWSPMVFNEFVYTAAKALLGDKELQKGFGLVNEAEEAVKSREYQAGQVPPKFLAATLGVIKPRLDLFKEHMRTTNDCWAFTPDPRPVVAPDAVIGGETLAKRFEVLAGQGSLPTVTLEDVMGWGELSAADCVIAMAAANVPAAILVTCDGHFTKAAKNIRNHLHVSVLDYLAENLSEPDRA